MSLDHEDNVENCSKIWKKIFHGPPFAIIWPGREPYFARGTTVWSPGPAIMSLRFESEKA